MTPDPELDTEPPGDEVSAASQLGGAVRAGDLVLRLTLGLGWITLVVAGFGRTDSAGSQALGVALLLTSLLILMGAIPRAATLAGLLLFLTLGSGEGSAGPLVLGTGAAIARLGLLSGASGEWLSRLRKLSRARTLHLVTTELARARAARSSSQAKRDQALCDAGDAYERAGRAGRTRQLIGAPEDRGTALADAVARTLGAGLGSTPWLRTGLEPRLAAASRRSDSRGDERPDASLPFNPEG